MINAGDVVGLSGALTKDPFNNLLIGADTLKSIK